MRETAGAVLGWAAALTIAFWVGVHLFTHVCSRAGCSRTFVAEWMLRQGGFGAGLVHGVEAFAVILTVIALVAIAAAEARARLP
jgi:hypothetical protein